MAATSKPFGWHAVARDPNVTLQGKPKLHDPKPYKPSQLPYPDTELVRRSLDRVRKELSPETLNHSLRLYYYGMAILTDQFPEWLNDGWINPETWMLTCLWHDIGTTHANLRKTHMSFEFWGGIEALNTLREFGAETSLAESVAESIIRHQDPGETGTILCLGFLIQMAAAFDNLGFHGDVIHPKMIKEVVAKYPRNGWSGCFANVVREEIGLKPYCHSTVIEGFADLVENNELMKPYDK